MAKKKKQDRKRSWCWYCDREFDEEKILIQHQKMKHFQCYICHRKLNSASGLVIHMAQVHKESMEKVPSAVEGHDTPELEIFGMDGIPPEDLQRHYDGLPLVPYTKSKMIIGDASILPILAAQKASVAMQLAESKNMTVQGELGGAAAVAAAVSVPIVPIVLPSSSAMSVVSPPLPSASAVNSVVAQSQGYSAPIASSAANYWPYMMPAPYGNVPFNQNQYAAYYQAYYATQAQAQSQSQGQVPVQTGWGTDARTAPYPVPITQPAQLDTEVMKANNIPLVSSTFTDPLTIPPHVDPNTNKLIPGTIFTVLSLDRSLEELRAELKKYQK